MNGMRELFGHPNGKTNESSVYGIDPENVAAVLVSRKAQNIVYPIKYIVTKIIGKIQ